MMKGWLRKMVSGIYKKSDIERAFGISAAESGAMAEVRHRWREMYLDTGGLGLAGAIAGELARLTTVEMKVRIDGGARGAYLEKMLKPLTGRLRRELEYGLAEGSLIFKPYYDGRELKIDVVKGESFTPISWDADGRITAAVFSQEIKKEDIYYTRLEYHCLEGDRYRIENASFKSRVRGELGKEVSLGEVEQWSALAKSLELTGISRPLFGFFRTPAANSTDIYSPMGASVYAKAGRLIEDADKLYKNLLWEFESGKRRLYVDVTAFDRDARGNVKLPDTELFRTIDINDSGFFSEWSPQFRNQALESGLNTILQRIEFNCSLAYGTLSQPSYVEKTAEEVKASKQRSCCFVCDLQSQLKTALEELIYAMDVWAQVYSLAPAGKYSCSFEFDDSIAADRRTEYEERVRLVELGAMKPWELRAWYLGESEETAKEAAGA